jgi:hypothetical protein
VFVSSHDAQVYALISNPQGLADLGPCSPGSSGTNGGANGECRDKNFMWFEVRITLSLPMSLSDFTKHKQKAFKASLLHAANLEGVVVSEPVVITKIESISSRRHLLEEHIRVETSLMTTDKDIAEAGAGNLTANSINRELSMACPQLPQATVLEAAKVVAVTQRPPPTKEAECLFTDTVMAQLPILFLCGLAYLGVKSKCSFAPKQPETPKMLPATGVAAPRQTPVTNSSTRMMGFPTTGEQYSQTLPRQMGPSEQRPPTVLPDGWQACIDQAGNIYYQNRTTKQTQWEHPARLFPLGELRTVTLNRNPSKDGAQQTGIGMCVCVCVCVCVCRWS